MRTYPMVSTHAVNVFVYVCGWGACVCVYVIAAGLTITVGHQTFPGYLH